MTFDSGSGPGCPSGYHWVKTGFLTGSCVKDSDYVSPVNPPDGHAYAVQRSSNDAGTVWLDIASYDNNTDAVMGYNYYIGLGGYYQLLKDGAIYLTNLAEADRWQPGEDTNWWAVQVIGQACNICPEVWHSTGTTYYTLKEAQDAEKALMAVQAGKYRIIDSTGVVSDSMERHEAIHCPEHEHWDEAQQTCVYDEGYPAQGCGAGQHWDPNAINPHDGTKGYCVSDSEDGTEPKFDLRNAVVAIVVVGIIGVGLMYVFKFGRLTDSKPNEVA